MVDMGKFLIAEKSVFRQLPSGAAPVELLAYQVVGADKSSQALFLLRSMDVTAEPAVRPNTAAYST